MPAAPPTTVEDMFVQTARGVRTADGAMTLLGLTPHTIYFSDRPERIVGHLTTHRFLQWWSEGDDSFAVDPPNAVLSWGEPGTDAPEEAVVVISDPAITDDGLRYRIETLQGTPPATAGPCVCCLSTRSADRSPRCRSLGCAAGICDGSADGSRRATSCPGSPDPGVKESAGKRKRQGLHRARNGTMHFVLHPTG